MLRSVGPHSVDDFVTWKGACSFSLSKSKGLAIASENEEFPLGYTVKVSARVDPNIIPSDGHTARLRHVKVLSVGGVELTAWSQRVGSAQEDPATIALAAERIKLAEAAEIAMRDRAGPAPLEALTDPTAAYKTAMQIVRRQRKLKEPKLSAQEIWHLRDTLNLLAEKLDIAGA